MNHSARWRCWTVRQRELDPGRPGADKTIAHWLNPQRYLLYSKTSALISLVFLSSMLGHSDLFLEHGYPPLFDFGVFWVGAWMARHGLSAQAYDLHALYVTVQNTVRLPAPEGTYGWFYPPIYFWVVLPLAWLPPFLAYLGFVVGTMIPYLGLLSRIAGTAPTLWWGVLGFAGFWFNLCYGQNGFLTATLAALALLLLERRPKLAGVAIGLLCFKPQLVLLFPVALVASRRWVALLSAVVVLAVWLGLTYWMWGPETFAAWLRSTQTARLFLELGRDVFWVKLPSLFAAATLLHISHPWAYAIQAGGAGVAVLLIWKLWRGGYDPRLQRAGLMLGSLLMSPYLLVYDLTWLVFVAVWWAQVAAEQGWQRYEREVLVGLWFCPYFMMFAETHLPIQYPPLLMLGGLWLMSQRNCPPSLNGRAGVPSLFLFRQE